MALSPAVVVLIAGIPLAIVADLLVAFLGRYPDFTQSRRRTSGLALLHRRSWPARDTCQQVSS